VLSCNQGGPNAVILGSTLAQFAVLAGTMVTNVGNTNVGFAAGATSLGVNDDLIGVSPGTAVMGFYPPGTDTDGMLAIYAAGFNTDRVKPATAQGELTTAFNTLAGRPASVTFPGPTDLSMADVGFGPGVLHPGVYKSPSTFSIASRDLVLDGGGDPQSVFIFQMGTALTTVANGGTSGNVRLQNGASACNIYWQAGSAATLGGATFYGNVLAGTAITVNATTFGGRALAESAGVSIPVAGGSIITNPGGR